MEYLGGLDDMRIWEKALRFTTPGSDAYVTTRAMLDRARELHSPPKEVPLGHIK